MIINSLCVLCALCGYNKKYILCGKRRDKASEL